MSEQVENLPSSSPIIDMDSKQKLTIAEAKCKEACGDSIPSAGYDYFDEVCGLLRVARGQRDDLEKRARRSGPKIVCLCGSLRFRDEFQRQEVTCLMRGEVAMLPCCMFTDIQREHGETSDYKQRADEQHKSKIAISDEVLVLNVGGYIGNSTRSEIDYAIKIGKPVRYIEPATQTAKLQEGGK